MAEDKIKSSSLALQKAFSLVPTTLKEAMGYAELMASSELVPAQFRGKKADVLIAVQMGAELGVPPLQALQSIAVINGRPTIWGDLGLALVEASGQLEFIKEDLDEEKLMAVCIVKRKGKPNEVRRTFSKKDAERAGLWDHPKKDPWRKYPKRMLQMRARWLALRDVFADVLKGVAGREEDFESTVVDVDSRIVQPEALMEPAAETEEEVRAFTCSRKGNGGGAAASSKPGQKLPSITGKVAAVDVSHSPARAKRKWTKYAVKMESGEELVAWDTNIGAAVEKGATDGIPLTLELKPSENKSYPEAIIIGVDFAKEEEGEAKPEPEAEAAEEKTGDLFD